MSIFPPAFLEELRQRLPLSQWIHKHTPLQKKGKEYVGLCPFHHEKSPSFTVNDEKKFYHCFGCGAHGDIVKFTMEREGLRFQEAIQLLAQAAGMKLPQPEERMDAQEKARKRLFQANRLAMEWFQAQLFSPQGKQALHYLQNRGLTLATIEQFQLGYAPDNDHALSDFLLSKGCDNETIIAAGLRVSTPTKAYDRFRYRIMFPICDTAKQVVAFGGRTLAATSTAKYMNSPESDIFKKGEMLYGEHIVQKYAYQQQQVILTEGYLDVIAMHQAGYPITLAPLGTATTEAQIKRLWQLAPTITLCLDGDRAGQEASYKIVLRALSLMESGKTMRVGVLPLNMDPDELLKEQGKPAMDHAIAQAYSLFEYIWQKESTRYQLHQPEARAACQKKLQELFATQVKDALLKKNFLDALNQQFFAVARRASVPLTATTPKPSTTLAAIPFMNLSTLEVSQYRLIALLLHYPQLMLEENIREEIMCLELSLERLSELRDRILHYAIEYGEGVLEKNLPHLLENEGYAHDIKLLCQQNNPLISVIQPLEYSKVKELLWPCTLYYYQIEVILKEFTVQAALPEVSQEKLNGLMEQVATLRKHIAAKEMQLQGDE